VICNHWCVTTQRKVVCFDLHKSNSMHADHTFCLQRASNLFRDQFGDRISISNNFEQCWTISNNVEQFRTIFKQFRTIFKQFRDRNKSNFRLIGDDNVWMSWGPFLTSPLGDKFDPRGEVVPQGWNLSPGGEVILWGWNSLFTPPFF
jgi:hypothetical protein